jgi:SSS family solute:Na+ symporter
VPEFLHRRFGSSVRTTYATLILLTYVVVEIAAVLYMGALAVNVLMPGIPLTYSVVVLAVATGLYTILGGLRAVVWTEMLQLGVLLTGGILLSIYTIRAVGGVSAFLETRDTWDLLLPASDPDFPWTMYLGGTLCISTFYCAANQFIVQRALAARDEWHARMGVVCTMYLKFLLPLIIIVPGLMGKKLFPNLAKPDLIFPTLVENLLPTGLVGLVMAGLIAAVMGHTSGAINSCTTIATIDFYLPWKKRRYVAERQQRMMPRVEPAVAGVGAGALGERGNDPTLSYESAADVPPPDSHAGDDGNDGATDAQAVRFGRYFGIVVIVIGIVGAEILTQHSKKPIFLYLLNAYGYFTPGIATMFLLGILWRRTTTPGALAAGLLTIPMSLALQWTFPSLAFQNRTGIVFWSCMIVCAVVSLMTTPKRPDELQGLIWTRSSLHLPPEERRNIAACAGRSSGGRS